MLPGRCYIFKKIMQVVQNFDIAFFKSPYLSVGIGIDRRLRQLIYSYLFVVVITGKLCGKSGVNVINQ